MTELTNLHTLNVSHNELYHKLGVIEGKLDALVGLEARIQNSLSDVDSRISSLEKWRWVVIGATVTVATALSFALSVMETFK